MDIAKFLYAQSGENVVLTSADKAFVCYRELKPPVKARVKYFIQATGQHVWREITIKSLYPKCFQDMTGWQKPYWCIEEWQEAN